MGYERLHLVPRSPAKLAEMARRAQLGLPLFDPSDRQLPDRLGHLACRARNGVLMGVRVVELTADGPREVPGQ